MGDTTLSMIVYKIYPNLKKSNITKFVAINLKLVF